MKKFWRLFKKSCIILGGICLIVSVSIFFGVNTFLEYSKLSGVTHCSLPLLIASILFIVGFILMLISE